MKKTAAEWLVDKLNKSTSLTSFVPECDEDYKQEILGIIKQAKEMEKEQIMDAFNYAQIELGMEADEYYEQIFKSE